MIQHVSNTNRVGMIWKLLESRHVLTRLHLDSLSWFHTDFVSVAQHDWRSLQAMGALAWTQHQPTCLALALISCQTRCAGASQDSLETEPLANHATTLRTMNTSTGHHAPVVLRQRCARKLQQTAKQLASVQGTMNAWATFVAAPRH